MSSSFQNPDQQQPRSVADILNAKVKQPKNSSRRYDYAREAQHPLACLVFVLPLVAFYEASIMLRPEITRSAIDRILQPWLEPLGSASLVVLPFLLVGALAFLYVRQLEQHRFRPQTLIWIFLESILLACILFVACDALMLYMDNQRPQPLAGLVHVFTDGEQYNRFITSLGSGIHEELVFRLLLFASSLWCLKETMQDERIAMVVATVLVSFLFAIAHCDIVNAEGLPFKVSTFAFRFFASSMLCILFRYRGFAVAVGVHAIFDILAIS